jgi:2-oxoglutarate dehydrogenase E1 component
MKKIYLMEMLNIILVGHQRELLHQGKKINMNLAPNPSHLESVDPIVQGIARAKLENDFDNQTNKVLPIIVHGDAAIAGTRRCL